MGRLLNGVGLRGVNQGGASLVRISSLQLMLSRVVRAGDLTMHDAREPGASLRRRNLAPRRRADSQALFERRLVMDPEWHRRSRRLDGRSIVEHGSLYEFVSLIMREIGRHPLPRWTRLPAGLRWLQRRLHQFNPTMRARSNVAHHYDIDPRIYELFLDEDRQYPARISRRGSEAISTVRNCSRSGTSRRSSISSRAIPFSTSAAAGADWRSTSPV